MRKHFYSPIHTSGMGHWDIRGVSQRSHCDVCNKDFKTYGQLRAINGDIHCDSCWAKAHPEEKKDLPMGWICPKCQNSCAPTVQYCPCSVNQKQPHPWNPIYPQPWNPTSTWDQWKS